MFGQEESYANICKKKNYILLSLNTKLGLNLIYIKFIDQN